MIAYNWAVKLLQLRIYLKIMWMIGDSGQRTEQDAVFSLSLNVMTLMQEVADLAHKLQSEVHITTVLELEC